MILIITNIFVDVPDVEMPERVMSFPQRYQSSVKLDARSSNRGIVDSCFMLFQPLDLKECICWNSVLLTKSCDWFVVI